MYGGDGNDRFVISELANLTSVNGGAGIDSVLFSGIQTTENDSSLINISEQYDVEHVDIVDSDLDLTDNSLSSISISNSVANVQLDGSSTTSTIESSIFNIETTIGDDAFYLKSNIAFGDNLVAFNDSNSEQTGTGVMVSIAGKIGYQGVIDGNAGLDSIHLSDRSEAFFIHDAFLDFHDTQILTEDDAGMLSSQRFKNIENILCCGFSSSYHLRRRACPRRGLAEAQRSSCQRCQRGTRAS
jgi:hypothetical protein